MLCAKVFVNFAACAILPAEGQGDCGLLHFHPAHIDIHRCHRKDRMPDDRQRDCAGRKAGEEWMEFSPPATVVITRT